jgi:hypothetical protein
MTICRFDAHLSDKVVGGKRMDGMMSSRVDLLGAKVSRRKWILLLLSSAVTRMWRIYVFPAGNVPWVRFP